MSNKLLQRGKEVEEHDEKFNKLEIRFHKEREDMNNYAKEQVAEVQDQVD